MKWYDIGILNFEKQLKKKRLLVKDSIMSIVL